MRSSEYGVTVSFTPHSELRIPQLKIRCLSAVATVDWLASPPRTLLENPMAKKKAAKKKAAKKKATKKTKGRGKSPAQRAKGAKRTTKKTKAKAAKRGAKKAAAQKTKRPAKKRAGRSMSRRGAAPSEHHEAAAPAPLPAAASTPSTPTVAESMEGINAAAPQAGDWWQ